MTAMGYNNTPLSVTLRCPREARASKGDGPGLYSRHPSRLAALAPQYDGTKERAA